MVYFNGKINTDKADSPIIGDFLPVSDTLGFFLDFQRGVVKTMLAGGENGHAIAQITISSTVKDPVTEINPLTSYIHYQNHFILYYAPHDTLSKFLYVWNKDFTGVLAAIAWTGKENEKIKLGKSYGEKGITKRLTDASLIPLSFIKLVNEL